MSNTIFFSSFIWYGFYCLYIWCLGMPEKSFFFFFFQAKIFGELHRIQKEKMPLKKRHLILVSARFSVMYGTDCFAHFADVSSTALHVCSLGQHFQNLFHWSPGFCICSVENYLHLSNILYLLCTVRGCFTN